MNLMTDLETLGTNSECPVISIGAVFFDGDGFKDEFYEVLDVSQQIKDGRRVDGDTIKWWMKQSGAAQKVFKEGAKDPVKVLKAFVKFCKKYGEIKPWGNGSNFDITILENLLDFYDIQVPWKFWNIRDLRTFKEYVYDGEDMPRTGTHHNALDDAKHQALVVIRGWGMS